MKKIFYIFIILASSCHQITKDDIIPNVIPEKYPNIESHLSIDTGKKIGNSFDLLGCGYDCSFENFNSTSYVRAKVIDVERFLQGKGIDPITNTKVLLPQGNINEALLYEGGFCHTIVGRNLEEYKNGVYNLNDVSSKTSNTKLDLFMKDVYGKFDLPFESAYYRKDYNKLTHRLTLSELDVEYLKYFLSQKFLNDLDIMDYNDLIIKYGTHVVTDITLGGSISIFCKSELTDYSTYTDFEKEVSYYCNNILSSNKQIDPKIIFKSCGSVALCTKITGGMTDHLFENNNVAFDFGKWSKSVNRDSEQIIGIGNNTTTIHLLSEFIDNPVKKRNLEKAIENYCNQSGTD